MSVVGIGTDLTEVARITRVLERFSDRFAKRILTTEEHSDWCGRGASAAWLAKRFAAKEALSKALGVGIGAQVSFHDLVISTTASGAPEASFRGGARALARSRGISVVHLSLSDEAGLALAFVVLERA